MGRNVLNQPLPRDHPSREPRPTLAWGLWSSGGHRVISEWPKHAAKPAVSAVPAHLHLPHCPPVVEGTSVGGGGEGTSIPEASSHTGHTLPTAALRRHLHAIPLLHKRVREGGSLACGHTAHPRHLRGLTLSLAGSDDPAPTHALQGRTVPPLCPYQSEGRTNWVQNNQDPDRLPEGKLYCPWGLSP